MGSTFDALMVDSVPEPSSLFFGGAAVMMGLVYSRRKQLVSV